VKVRAPHVRRTSSALLPAAVAWLFLVAVPVTASPIKLSDQSMAANPGPVSPAPASAPSAGTTSVDITLWKYICPSYDVVPANAKGDNVRGLTTTTGESRSPRLDERETSRLCREDSQSLTAPGVT